MITSSIPKRSHDPLGLLEIDTPRTVNRGVPHRDRVVDVVPCAQLPPSNVICNVPYRRGGTQAANLSDTGSRKDGMPLIGE